MESFEGFETVNGQKILTLDYVQSLRDADRVKNNPLTIIAQRGAQERMLSQNVDILIGGGNRGGPLLVDTKVVTPFGYRRIDDLKAGDIISGLDGGMQRVIYKVNHGMLPSYKLKFIDGSEVIASSDHPWNIRRTCYATKKRHLNNGELRDDWHVWTTEMIVDFLKKRESGELKNGHIVVPLCEPVKFTNSQKRYGVDPYLLGVILGDGCITDNFVKYNNICITTDDAEIVGAFKEAGYDIHLRQKKNSIDYVFKAPDLVEILTKWKLAGHNASSKFVPRVFYYGTVEERFAILQGLMDTDGSIDKRGHCSYTTISEQLAKDVKYLVNSLGGLATISKGETFYNKDGVRVQCSDAYNVYIRIKDSHRIFRLARKKNLSTAYNGGISEYTRRIVGYEFVGMKECCCIRVSNPNSLFMVEDFIVTHNSKTYSLLLEGLRDCQNKNFNGVIFRKEKPDLRTIEETSESVYSQYGIYNRSDNKKEWLFYSGGKLKFNYYNDEYSEFKDRFQGHQYAYIGVDEITQMPYNKFKYILTCNRNAYGIRNRFFGTCNPDPDSWVRKFIAYWIDAETGLPIPERDGHIRYCFMDGDNPDSIYWGDSPEEVYEQCSEVMDEAWTQEMEDLGYDKARTLCKTVTFIKAGLTENLKLLESDPTYLASLAGQDEEQRMRDLAGNWNFKNAGDDMIKMQDLEEVFLNSHQVTEKPKDYASADIAFTGGDNLVMWHWKDFHIVDLFVCRADSRTVVAMVKEKLAEWGVLEENFTYDLNGIGQYFKGYFPDAVPFNNMAAPIAQSAKDEKGIKALYANLKSQCAYILYLKIKNKEISIDERLLDRKYSGNGFEKTPLRQILMKERKCFRRSEVSNDKGFALIKKSEMKKWVGHSPDFWESLLYRMIFEVSKRHKKVKGLWMC